MLLPSLTITLQRLYREKGENLKHSYTLSGDLPEMVQAKLNARNLSEVKGICSLTGWCSFHVKPSSYIRCWTFSEHLQGILDEDPWWRLQAAPGCHSFPVSQILLRDSQWCECSLHSVWLNKNSEFIILMKWNMKHVLGKHIRKYSVTIL